MSATVTAVWGRIQTATGPPAVLLAAVAIGVPLSGCGGGSGGDSDATLAELAPAAASVYFEGTVQPEGEQAAAIESIASRFPGGTDLGQQIIDDLDAGLEARSSPEDPSTFAADIQPWLGERLAFFLTDVGSDPETGEDATATLIVETTDAEQARASIEELAASSTEDETETEVDGVSLFVDENDEAAGVVGDHVVFGPTASVEEVIAVESADGDDLAGREDFTFDVGGADGSSALAFSWIDTEAVIEQSLDPETAAGFEEGQLNELIAEAGFDATAPATFVLAATEGSAVLDSSVGIAESYEEGTGELLAKPSWRRVPGGGRDRPPECPAGGIRLGIERAAAEDGVSPEDAQQQIKAAYGVTVSELADALGGSAFYLTGSPGVGLSGAAVVEVVDPAPVEDVLRTIPQLLPLINGSDVRPLSPILPDDLEGISLTTTGIAQRLTIASDGELLVVALGEEAAAAVFEPSETLADSGRLEGGDGLEGYETNAAFDLQGALPVIQAASASDPDFIAALPYLEAIAGATSGSRVDGDRLITRTVIGFG